MKIDEVIREKLSKREIKKLFSLCKKYFPLPLHVLDGQEEYLKNNPKNSAGKGCEKKLKEIRIIHHLYSSAGIDEKNYLFHWHILRARQSEAHRSYQKMVSPERKDNKTYLNRGNGCSNANKVRYPKKVRKTAWKRFYKLFPNLAPKEKLNDNLTNS